MVVGSAWWEAVGCGVGGVVCVRCCCVCGGVGVVLWSRVGLVGGVWCGGVWWVWCVVCAVWRVVCCGVCCVLWCCVLCAVVCAVVCAVCCVACGVCGALCYVCGGVWWAVVCGVCCGVLWGTRGSGSISL